MPKKVCNEQGCNTLIDISDRYCAKHKQDKKMQDAKRDKIYNATTRNQKHSNFYNSHLWRKVRKQVMNRTGGLCKQCLALDMNIKADVVDHIIPIEIDWNLRLRLDNLQPLCNVCHNKKTAQDKIKYGGRV